MVFVGNKVFLKGLPAVVRFVGPTQFSTGIWVGLELNTPDGKNNGSVQGVEYFTCEQEGNYGVFVRPSILEKEATPVQLDVVSVVNRLQQKLRDTLTENSSLRASKADLLKEIENFKSDLHSAESNLELVAVEAEYLREQNRTLLTKVDEWQIMHDDLKADYAILKEELDIYKELEEVVMNQVPSEENITSEDLTISIQLNKRLELAYSSLERLMTTKENNFNSEIDSLRKELALSVSNKQSYDVTVKELQAAEVTIKLLKEQLETSLELVLVAEHLAVENDALRLRISELNLKAEELTELNEIDRDLELEHIKKEDELRESIIQLSEALEHEKSAVTSLINSNEELKKSLQRKQYSENATPSNEMELMSIELRLLRSQLQELFGVNTDLKGEVSLLERFATEVFPVGYKAHFELLLSIDRCLFKVGSVESHERNLLWLHAFVALLQFARLVIEHYYENVDIEAMKSQISFLQSAFYSQRPFMDSDSGADGSLAKSIDYFETFLLLQAPDWMHRTWNLSKIVPVVKFIEQVVVEEAGENDDLFQAKITKCRNIEDNIRIFQSRDKLAGLELLNADFSFSSLSYLPTSELPTKLDFIYDNIVKSQVKYPENVGSIYSITDEVLKKAQISIELLHSQLEDKQYQIQDLKLHVGLLEKNMKLSLAERNAQLTENATSFEAAEAQIVNLKNQLKKIQQHNVDLEQQLEAVFELERSSVFLQTAYFNSKSANSESTLTETLVEEIQLLQRMLEPQQEKKKWSKDIDWLYEPLCTRRSTRTTMASFLEAARQRKKRTTYLVKSLSMLASNSLRMHSLPLRV